MDYLFTFIGEKIEKFSLDNVEKDKVFFACYKPKNKNEDKFVFKLTPELRIYMVLANVDIKKHFDIFNIVYIIDDDLSVRNASEYINDVDNDTFTHFKYSNTNKDNVKYDLHEKPSIFSFYLSNKFDTTEDIKIFLNNLK